MTAARAHDAPPILLVEADPSAARSFARAFSDQGIFLRLADDAVGVLATLAREPFALVVQDLGRLTAGHSANGRIELFRAIRRIRPQLPILLLASWSANDLAAQLLGEGAVDYLSMPCNEDRLASTALRLLLALDRSPLAAARADLAARVDLCGAAYGTPSFHQLVLSAVRAAPFHTPVLITGARGSGRSHLARIVQANSPRRGLPFLRIEGATLTVDQIAGWRRSERPVRGAPAVDRADPPRGGGTVLVENVHELTPAAQAALLDFLRGGDAARGERGIDPDVDVRLIATASENLQLAVRSATFSRALHRQLAEIELVVPPLSERPADTVALARSFLADLPARHGAAWSLDEGAERALAHARWPDGSRGLKQAVMRAGEISESPNLTAAAFGLMAPAKLTHDGENRLAPLRAPLRAEPAATHENRLAPYEEVEERRRLEEALARHGGIVSRAAESLGLSRQSFYRRLQRHGLSAPSTSSPNP